jgi:hypothetical protein
MQCRMEVFKLLADCIICRPAPGAGGIAHVPPCLLRSPLVRAAASHQYLLLLLSLVLTAVKLPTSINAHNTVNLL